MATSWVSSSLFTISFTPREDSDKELEDVNLSSIDDDCLLSLF